VSFASRVFLGTLAVLLVTVFALTFAANRWLRQVLEDRVATELERQTRVVAAALPHDTSTLNEAAHRLGNLVGSRVTLIDVNGRVLGDSDFDDASLALLENHRTRPEVIAAFRDGSGIDARLSASTGRQELKVAVAAWPGIVRLSATLEQVDEVVHGAVRTVVISALAALALGALLAAIAGRAVSGPLRAVARGARGLAVGVPPAYPSTGAPEIRELVHALRSMHDELSERMGELQREREETATMIDSMAEGVIATNERGDPIVVNDTARRVLDYGPDDPLPNIRELFHQSEARRMVERVLDGEPVIDLETTLDGRSVLITARSLPTGGAVLGLNDLTHLRRLEVVRRDFVANVSHELKTPLTSVSGYLETLLSGEQDPATRRHFLQIARNNAHRMQRLVDDLLDLSRLESGGWEPEPEPIDVRQAADEAWTPFAPTAADRGITFACHADAAPTLYADPDAVGQILTNLFDNAVRHTGPGGRIVCETRSRPDGVELAVRDTGTGIPADQLPRIFERFYRVDPGRSRAEGGTGLGLAIVKHLAEGHGGKVSAESNVGAGTVVRVFFPTSIPQAS